MRKIFFNGEIKDESEAKISVYDSAMLFGDTCFEMLRTFKGVQFKLDEHIDRLFVGLKILKIDIPYTKEDIKNQILALQKLHDFDEHRIMIDVTRGLLSIYEDVDVNKGCNVIITDFPLHWTVAGMSKLFDIGINAVIPSQRSIPSRYLDPKIKNRSRIHYLKANLEVSEYEGENNWALLTDDNGFITEGTGDNFFIIKGETLYTPEGRNILRGISRDYVMWLCARMGYHCFETNLEPYDVYNADGAMICATPFCMLPVTKLNGLDIGDGKPHKLFNEILDNWSAEVGVNIKKQMQGYDEKYKKRSGVNPYSFK